MYDENLQSSVQTPLKLLLPPVLNPLNSLQCNPTIKQSLHQSVPATLAVDNGIPLSWGMAVTAKKIQKCKGTLQFASVISTKRIDMEMEKIYRQLRCRVSLRKTKSILTRF